MKFVDDSRIPVQPYPELRRVLQAFTHELQSVLSENLVGFYLVGSLAVGDFDLDSDVDFMVVIRQDLAAGEVSALEAAMRRMHAMDCYPAQHLEGSFITISDLIDWSTVGVKKLVYFDNGSTQTEMSTHDNQWHVRWILRERPAPLYGPEPGTLLPAIPTDKMKEEAKKTMLLVMDRFTETKDAPLTFFNSRFGQPYAVLTACRLLHTIETGTVQSKKAGMQWALDFLDPKWAGFIRQSWREREGVRFCIKIRQRAEQKDLDDTLAFVRYTASIMKANQE